MGQNKGVPMFVIGEFKGNPVITLKQGEDDSYGFTFGLTKAKLVLDHLEDIRKFYEENKDKKKAKA
jgi:hypothetical protein